MIEIDPRWRTSSVMDLADEVRRDESRMPALADALSDAGCTDEDLLDRCRNRKNVYLVAASILGGDAAESFRWIDNFSGWVDSDFDEIMQLAGSGDWKTQYGGDSWRDTWYDNEGQFWEHYERLTGKESESKHTLFSCAC